MIELRLHLLMAERRLNMSELEKLSGVNRSTLHRMYHGKAARVDLDVIDKLCHALKCVPGDLFYYEK